MMITSSIDRKATRPSQDEVTAKEAHQMGYHFLLCRVSLLSTWWIRDFFAASKKATQIAQEEDEGNLAEEEIEKDSLVADTGVSDLDYLKSRMKAKDRFQEVDESEEESEESESDISSDSEESEESESDDSSASDLESEDHTESG